MYCCIITIRLLRRLSIVTLGLGLKLVEGRAMSVTEIVDLGGTSGAGRHDTSISTVTIKTQPQSPMKHKHRTPPTTTIHGSKTTKNKLDAT